MPRQIKAHRLTKSPSSWVSILWFFATVLLSTTCGFPTPPPSLLRRSMDKCHHHRNGPRCAALVESPGEESSLDLLRRKKRQLTREFVQIGGPALLQLAAEPLAALVDTAYLGRLGPDVLGGAGVAVSAQYAVSKLYNDPLLRTSISLVASQQGKQQSSSEEDGDSTDLASSARKKNDLSIAVSSALLLAATVGVVQLVVYTVFCRLITRSMGLSPASSMWHSAVSYLQVRALGTPAATLWLVTNGIFRGLGDTRTPLVYSLAFTGLNIVLDPIFIFVFGWGASGAAAGTALAQYAALVPLVWALHRRVPINIWGRLRDLQSSLRQYLQAGSLVLFRTMGKVAAYSACARQAALLGPVAAAAYNITFQLGFATTQICEAVAVAVQTLLAREMAVKEGDSDDTESSKIKNAPSKAAIVRHLINGSVGAGGFVAVALSLVTWLRRDWVLAGLTTDPNIRAAAASIFPVVLLTQVLKGLAYPVNGIIMGGLDWFFTMNVMWLANIVCVGLLRYFRRTTGTVSLSEIWWALAAFMGTQVVAGMVRYESKTGVWKVLRGKKKKDDSNVSLDAAKSTEEEPEAVQVVETEAVGLEEPEPEEPETTQESIDGDDENDADDAGDSDNKAALEGNTEKTIGTTGNAGNDDSIKSMLKFALPALGIYLSNPMLSNIDNAFVGRTAGVIGLAALSPATICTDQMLYLFSFLSRATTGMVSRAYGVTKQSETGNTAAAREAASAPLTVALICGVFLSLFYAWQTPNLLAALHVQPSIQPLAASYVYTRGAVAWAALAQAVALSVMMATRDSVTPLKIIGLAALLNVVGDYALCVWPLHWGCTGAAAATAAATLLSSGFMLRGLHRKGILPKIRLPSRKELKELLGFTGPLMAITLTRLGGFVNMQRRAMSLGVKPLAGYQLAVNMMIFFILFGEPLSQLFQTKLPALIDAEDHDTVASTFGSVLKLAGVTSVAVAALAGLALYFGAPGFTADAAVQAVARQASPSLFLAVLATVFGIAMDGAMLASRDFGFILITGIGSFLAQMALLPRCHSIEAILGTYTMRLSTYSAAVALRLGLGQGSLGRVLRTVRKVPSPVKLVVALLFSGSIFPTPAMAAPRPAWVVPPATVHHVQTQTVQPVPVPSFTSPVLTTGVSSWLLADNTPSKADVQLLRQAFAEFYGVNRDLVQSEKLLSQVIDLWQGQPPDERAALYRVRGDCYTLLADASKAESDYSTAIELLRKPESQDKADPSELPAALLGRARALKAQGDSSKAPQASLDYEHYLKLSSREEWDTDQELLEDGATRNPYAAWEWGTVLRASGQYTKAGQAHALAAQAFAEIGDKARSAISLTDAGIDYAAADNIPEATTILRKAVGATPGVESRDVALLQRVIAKEGEGRLALAALLWNDKTQSDGKVQAEKVLGDACVRLEQMQAQAVGGGKAATTGLPSTGLRFSIDDALPSATDVSCYRFKNPSFLDQLGWPEDLQKKVIKLETLR